MACGVQDGHPQEGIDMIITVARKPLSEPTVTANVLEHGCGAINVDGARVGTGIHTNPPRALTTACNTLGGGWRTEVPSHDVSGRWPANPILQGEDEVGGASRYFKKV